MKDRETSGEVQVAETSNAVPPAELRRRAERARASLTRCTMCEHRCGVNRLGGEPAPCGLSGETYSFKRHLSFAEELELLPSYMVYLDGCNFRCRFCVQAPTCFVPNAGTPVDASDLAEELRDVLGGGARTINLLGGEPSLHVHTILAIAAEASSPLPLVLNSNMYMTPEVLELLDGVVSTYVADFKFGNNRCAETLAGASRYVEVVTRNLVVADRQSELIVRHLLMPGHFECCFVPVAEWIASHLPHARFSLMEGYVPAWRTTRDNGPLGATVDPAAVRRARRVMEQLGLNAAPAAPDGPGASRATPRPANDPVVTIRIDRHGRLLFHDLTHDMLPVARAVCPTDDELARRVRAGSGDRSASTLETSR